MTTYPLVIWTIDSYLEQGYTADQICPRGHGRKPIDLKAWQAKGCGGRPVKDLGLKCHCGARAVFTIHAPSRFAK